MLNAPKAPAVATAELHDWTAHQVGGVVMIEGILRNEVEPSGLDGQKVLSLPCLSLSNGWATTKYDCYRLVDATVEVAEEPVVVQKAVTPAKAVKAAA